MKVELSSLLDIAREDNILFLENSFMFPPTAGRNGGYPPRGQDLPSSFQGTVIHWMLNVFLILKHDLTSGRSLDIPFNETAEEEKKTIQGRSLDVQPNGDVFQAESRSIF